MSALTLSSGKLKIVEKLVYLGSCISAVGGISDEVNLCISKTRAAYIKLVYLWRLFHDILAVKCQIYNASATVVWLYTFEIWSLRVEDVKRLSVFVCDCLRKIADI